MTAWSHATRRELYTGGISRPSSRLILSVYNTFNIIFFIMIHFDYTHTLSNSHALRFAGVNSYDHVGTVGA